MRDDGVVVAASMPLPVIDLIKVFQIWLQGVNAEKEALDTQLQKAQAANHSLTAQLSSMATELETAKQAQLASATQLQV